MIESFLDEYARKTAPILRKLNDFRIIKLGTKVNALILKVDNINALDDEETSIKESKEMECYIKYPGEMTTSRSRDKDGNLREDNTIYLEDILPIELFVPLADQINTVEENDLIIHCLWDEKENCMFNVFQTLRSLGKFHYKELVTKKFILNNIRSTLNSNILNKIKDHIAAKENERTYI